LREPIGRAGATGSTEQTEERSFHGDLANSAVPKDGRQYRAARWKVQPYLCRLDHESTVSYACKMRQLVLPSCVMAASGLASAQTAPSEMTIEQAISFALAHHPSLRARAALDRAAEARTSEARSGLLPDLDVSLQLNRATGNVLQGALFPMRNIPNISG